MYQITSTILNMFDIKKLKRQCNYPGCNNKPEKEIYIYEYTIKRKIGLATIYLCNEHINTVKGLVTKIKNIEPKAIIESRQKTIK